MSSIGQTSADVSNSPTITDTVVASTSKAPSISSGTISLSSPIGYIRSCFKSKNGTPRQPSVCTYSKAKLKILKSVFVCPDHSLDGLENFSHVWILFIFHENHQESFTKAKVKPPRLDGKKVGVFASRSPHRPNPIGLTLAKLDKVEGDTLYLSGMDMIEGTPVLDVKPYVPDYDNPKVASSRTVCEHGAHDKEVMKSDSIYVGKWIAQNENKHSSKSEDADEDVTRTTAQWEKENSLEVEDVGGDDVRVVDWVGDPPIRKLTVRFTPTAQEQLASLCAQEHHKLEFLDSYGEAFRAIQDILSADPRSVYRRNSCSDRLYYFTIDNLHITSWFGRDFAEVVQVQHISLADIPKHTAGEESSTIKSRKR